MRLGWNVCARWLSIFAALAGGAAAAGRVSCTLPLEGKASPPPTVWAHAESVPAAPSIDFRDCNMNGRDDLEDILLGTSRDLNGDLVPDECQPAANTYLMVCDSTARRVMLFDRHEGALVNPAFISGDAVGLRRPTEALQVGDRVWVSDQLADSIFLFNLHGEHVSTITGRLDDIRGMDRGLHPVHGEIVYVTNGGPGNGAIEDTVVMFATDGTRLGEFAAGTNPWDVLNYNGKLLVSDINVEDILLFDYEGNFLGIFHDSNGVNGIDFPGQMSIKSSNGNVLAAGFSPPVGLYEYDPSGTQVNAILTGGPGARGVHELGDGNLLWTDDAGTHVYNPATLSSVTRIAGVHRFATLVTLPDAACYADCDPNPPLALDIFDFLCFQNRYAQGDPYACDCDISTGQGICDIFDFLCFQNRYAQGCGAQLLDARFTQADLILNGPPVPNSDWASVDIDYVGSREVLYFNLQRAGQWVIQNAPIVSTEGPGVLQTKTMNFPTGLPRGINVDSFFDITFELTTVPLETPPPPSTRKVPVGDRPVRILTGEVGEQVVATPAQGIQGGAAPVTSAFNSDMPNQDCQLNGCVPAAMSNSLKFLKAKHGLNIPDNEISLQNMKNVTGWGPGGATWPDWWTMKQAWANGRGITTTTTQDPAVAAAALKRNCDVEMRVPGHVAAVTGMVKLASGKWAIWVKHDTDQGNAGGTKEELVIYNPMDGTVWDGFGFDRRGPATFVIECPS